MSWSKLKQQLESFLSPALAGRVEYRATGYRYLPDRSGLCYIAVDKKNVFNMSDAATPIRWYQTELEIKNDPAIQVPISEDEREAVRIETKGNVPEERLMIIAGNRKKTELAKALFSAQSSLSRSNFAATAITFLSTSIEASLESEDLLLNVLALIDRRVGKKRLLNLSEKMKAKHPIVRYFYELRLGTV